MFGYLTADTAKLTEAQQVRYRAAYCGLCRTLRTRYGRAAQWALTYDMTFLLLLLASLHEPDEQTVQRRCAAHPLHPHPEFSCAVTDYAAALNVLLAREQCLDAWHDDHDLSKRTAAALLTPAFKKAAAAYPEQAAAIRAGLDALSVIEARSEQVPDKAANAFGGILAALFVWREDRWAATLRELGFALGKFLYLLDAVCDRADDVRRGRYNPFAQDDPQHFRPLLTLLIGDAAAAFERLPLVQDADILRNILYSGLWVQYDRQFPPDTPEKEKHP